MLRGRVVAVADGDTITVLDAAHIQHRIRLAGIDAPELSQAFGRVAKANLSRLVFQREVEVHVTKTDRYNRLVGKVIVDGRDVCLEQLRAGLAWFYTDYQFELSPADRAAYSAAGREASAARRGLWADPSRIPPWQVRRNARSGGSIAPRIPQPPPPGVTGGTIVGNRRSHIYHRSDCPDFNKVSPQNRESFPSEAAAVAAGYRKAGNCP